MGYTHYWSFNKPKKGKAQDVEKLYQQAIKDCQKVIAFYQRQCKKLDMPEDRLSGYSAHTANYGGIFFNGKQELAHEDFCLREHYSQNEDFNFCKTARKPYDVVVTACLAILKYRLGDNIEVSSDGNFPDWEYGTELARKVLRRKIKNPIEFNPERDIRVI